MIIFKQSLAENHPKIASYYNNIGLVYQRQMKYSEHTNIAHAYRELGHFNLALEHSNISLNIYKKCLPSQHPQIGWTFDCIAFIYEKTGEYQLALEYFQKAEDLFHHALPSTHYYLKSSQEHIQRITSQLK